MQENTEALVEANNVLNGEPSKLATLEQIAAQPRISPAEAKRLYRRWAKLLRRVERPARMTKRGCALQPDAHQDADEARLGRRWTYRMTSREALRRKHRRQQQRICRRANRG